MNPPHRRDRDSALSEVLTEVVLILLLCALAGIVITTFLGLTPFTEKTAYVVVGFQAEETGGVEVISVFDRGGDEVWLNDTKLHRGAALARFDVAGPDGSTATAVPDPDMTTNTFAPGDTLTLYRCGDGVGITDNLSAVVGRGTVLSSFEKGTWRVSVIDATHDVLIASEGVAVGGTGGGNKTGPITAEFNATQENGLSKTLYFAGRPVTFAANTTNATSWAWDFGDGGTADGKNVTHTFARGTYTVTLNASNSARNISVQKQIAAIPWPSAWWRLDGDTTDASGNGNTGTIYNKEDHSIPGAWVSGVTGEALQLSGNSYVRVPDSASLDLSPGGTIYLWMKPSVIGNYYTVIGKGANDQNDNYEWLIASGGKIIFEYHDVLEDDRSATSDVDLVTSGGWISVATVFDGSTIEFYRNGAIFDSKSMNGNLHSSSEPLRIGKQQMLYKDGKYYPFYYRGSLDEIMIFKETLASNEIKMLNDGFTA